MARWQYQGLAEPVLPIANAAGVPSVASWGEQSANPTLSLARLNATLLGASIAFVPLVNPAAVTTLSWQSMAPDRISTQFPRTPELLTGFAFVRVSPVAPPLSWQTQIPDRFNLPVRPVELLTSSAFVPIVPSSNPVVPPLSWLSVYPDRIDNVRRSVELQTSFGFYSNPIAPRPPSPSISGWIGTFPDNIPRAAPTIGNMPSGSQVVNPIVPSPCFTLLNSTKAASTNNGVSVTSSPMSTIGANLLVVVYVYNISAPTFTDSQGNTWTIADTRFNTNTHEVVAYCYNPSTSANHTVSVVTNGTTAFPAVVFAAFSGSAASPLDQATGTATSSTGTITPTQANELIISGYCSLAGTPAVAGVTLLAEIPVTAGQNIGIGMGYTAQFAATPVAATWTVASMNASSIVSFKAQCSATGTGLLDNILNTTIFSSSNRGAITTYNPTGGMP